MEQGLLTSVLYLLYLFCSLTNRQVNPLKNSGLSEVRGGVSGVTVLCLSDLIVD